MKIYISRFLFVIIFVFVLSLCYFELTTNIVYGSTQQELLVEKAKSQVGVKERSAGSDDIFYNDWYYGHSVNNNGVSGKYAWCAVFVSWCADQVGIPTNIIYKECGTTRMKNGMINNNGATYHLKGSGYIPQKGDIIFFGTDAGQHVGIVDYSSGSTVYYIDGNNTQTTPHGVHYSSCSLSYSNLWGFVTPKYVNSNNPIGAFDGAVGGYNSINVSGWAFDADDTSQALAIHVYIGGEAGSAGTEGHSVDSNGNGIIANESRTDVNNVYGCGDNHGFSATIDTNKTGTQTIYIYAINIGGGNNTLLGSKTVNIQNLDYKCEIDSPNYSNLYNSDLYIQGWSISQNAITAVQYSLNGGTWTNTKRYDRTDVRNVYPEYPDGNEGYMASISKYRLKKGSNTIKLRTIYDGGYERDIGTRTINVNYDYIPEDIFEYNGNMYAMYYAPMTWTEADSLCKNAGGHLVTIDDERENEEITKHLNGHRYWIGLNDASTEGSFVWSNGSTSTYRNFSDGEPNNTNDNEDYCEIISTGKWNDIKNEGDSYLIGFILEIEKSEIYLSKTAIFENSLYEFYNSKMPWSLAKFYAELKGGYLVTINSVGENEFIKGNITDTNWIGMTDEEDEGVFKWITDDDSSYTNWSEGEPNNLNGIQSYGTIFKTGKWDDDYNYEGHNFIIKYPSSINAKIETPVESEVFKGDETITISGYACSQDEISNVCIRVNSAIYDVERFDREDIRGDYPNAIDGNEGFKITLPKSSFKYGANTTNIILNMADGKSYEFGNINFTVYKSFEPINVGYYNGKIYAVYEDVNSWTEAKEFCETRGGNLAAITTKAEQNYITSLLNSKNVDQYWIGATRGDSDTYSWVTGESFAYSNWSTGEPNNYGGTENCIVMKSTGKWNDEDAYNPYPVGFVYEFDTNNLEVSQYSTFGNSEYYLYNKSVPYAIAEKFAEISGGHILNITSAEEESNILAMIEKTNGVVDRVWLSLNDCENEGIFKWNNKEPLNYTNWAEGEPNNSSGIEDYVTFNLNGWNDVKADYSTSLNGFIVEFSEDINQSGKNDRLDATMILRHLSGIESLTDEQYSRADIDGNGEVNIFDVTAILMNNT